MAARTRAQWTGKIVFQDLVVSGRLFSAESEKPEELTLSPIHIKCKQRLDLPMATKPKTRVAVERPDRRRTVIKKVGQAKQGFFCQTCGIAVPKEELGKVYEPAEGEPILLTSGEIELLEVQPMDEVHAEFIAETDPLLDTFGTDRRMLFVPNIKDIQSVINYWKVFQALQEQGKLAYFREFVIVRNIYSAIIRPVTLDARITQRQYVDILVMEGLRDPRVTKDPHQVTEITPRQRFGRKELPVFQTRQLDLDSILTPRIELLRRLVKAKALNFTSNF